MLASGDGETGRPLRKVRVLGRPKGWEVPVAGGERALGESEVWLRMAGLDPWERRQDSQL